MAGILDGQSLSAFVPGFIYNIDTHLAVQLIALGGATEDFTTTLPVPLDTAHEMNVIEGGVRIIRARQKKSAHKRKSRKRR